MGKVECRCKDWKEGIKQIDDHQEFMWRAHGQEPIGKPFKFCPWCGKNLLAQPKQATFTPPIKELWRGPAGRGRVK